ncbi:MAG TPA: tetraacyldisaccharide 4'-kinase [Terracidiphilus sp.]|jgi:tetraacyldisaccharide 4'-kinase
MRRLWLAPLIPLYRLALALRELRLRSGLEQVRRLRYPVVSVGNLSTGGSGKTPLTIALAQALAARGLRVDILSRGYGRKSELARRVDPNGAAEDFGDEPLLIARETGIPVYVASQRYDAGLLAEAEAMPTSKQNHPPIVHLLDDGFQHRQLYRDVDILLLSHNDLTDCLLPAGNLREPVRPLQRATILAVPADEPDVEQYLQEIIPIYRNSETSRWNGPIWRLRRTIEIPAVNSPVTAFCGIARPEQFFAGLEASGLRLAFRTAFTDHHRYTVRDLDRLIAAAHAAGATALLTTEKDLVRMGSLASIFPASLPLTTAHLRIEIENQQAAIDWLIGRLSS